MFIMFVEFVLCWVKGWGGIVMYEGGGMFGCGGGGIMLMGVGCWLIVWLYVGGG